MNKAFEKILGFIDEQIKIEESIAKSENEGHPITHQYGANCMNVIKNFVHQVAEEYNGGWIPCSERLPDVEADVLLSLRSLDICTGFRANTDGCFYIDGDTYVEYENVIAWQKLPEPYKPEGELKA